MGDRAYAVVHVIQNSAVSKGMSSIIGSVVQGPRGGIYVLDRFCTEQFVVRQYNLRGNTDTPERLVLRLVASGKAKITTMSCIKGEKTKALKDYAKSIGATDVLLKKDGYDKVREWSL